MRKLAMGCAVAGLLVLTPSFEPGIPAFLAAPALCTQRSPRTETGVASWYGAERQEKPTASGELFDMNKLTGAHRLLPLGTIVRITNLSNRKITQLRINDRGPGPATRLI